MQLILLIYNIIIPFVDKKDSNMSCPPVDNEF